MVTQDVDFVLAAEKVDLATKLLQETGFKAERFPWSITFQGRSKVGLRLSTEDFCWETLEPDGKEIIQKQ